MSNPVLNKISSNWQRTTPAGYPAMPGYRVGNHNTHSQPTHPYDYQNTTATSPAMDEFERSYAAPSADAVDRAAMTYDDVIIRTATLLAIVTTTGALGWGLMSINPLFSAGAMLIGSIGALVLALLNTFSSTIRPSLIMAYAAFQGLALGGLSAMFELRHPGIVVQALVATVAVFSVTLALFSSGKVRNSPKMQRFVLIALAGILAYRLLAWGLTFFGAIGSHPDTMTIMGLPLGAVIGTIAVLIGAMSLIGDFDQVQHGVRTGVPARMAWMCAFGMMVTIVWMYTELLRLLSYFRD